jgi:hypothetical protein
MAEIAGHIAAPTLGGRFAAHGLNGLRSGRGAGKHAKHEQDGGETRSEICHGVLVEGKWVRARSSKFQIPSTKFQGNSKDRNSKLKTKTVVVQPPEPVPSGFEF